MSGGNQGSIGPGARRARVGRLVVECQDIVHRYRFAHVISGDEFGLLRGCSYGVDQRSIPYLDSDVTDLSSLQNVHDQSYVTMASVTGLPCPAVWVRQADQSWRDDEGLALCTQHWHGRYER
jgi:hypothetical protein